MHSTGWSYRNNVKTHPARVRICGAWIITASAQIHDVTANRFGSSKSRCEDFCRRRQSLTAVDCIEVMGAFKPASTHQLFYAIVLSKLSLRARAWVSQRCQVMRGKRWIKRSRAMFWQCSALSCRCSPVSSDPHHARGSRAPMAPHLSGSQRRRLARLEVTLRWLLHSCRRVRVSGSSVATPGCINDHQPDGCCASGAQARRRRRVRIARDA